MADLWHDDSKRRWREALDAYPDVIERQGVASLPELDRWAREELPQAIAKRRTPHVTHAELVRLTEWKMARGVWRARNLVLVKGNAADVVTETSTRALAAIPDPRAPIATLATLDGVGPATASGVASAAAPELYPFFDEIVAARIPALGTLGWTLPFYVRYAAALRERAARLGPDWTPTMLERALWADAGGKTGHG